MLVTSFANIFSQSVGFLFILFIVSFDVQKLLSLVGLHLFIFVFFHYSERWIKKAIAMIYINLDSILESRDITLSTKVRLVKTMASLAQTVKASAYNVGDPGSIPG